MLILFTMGLPTAVVFSGPMRRTAAYESCAQRLGVLLFALITAIALVAHLPALLLLTAVAALAVFLLRVPLVVRSFFATRT
jgi:hypothetical protein